MMEYFIVQMQRTDGSWFAIDDARCTKLSVAIRKAKARRKKNIESRNPVIRPLPVRIVRRIETVEGQF
jgi:hypothetical protein